MEDGTTYVSGVDSEPAVIVLAGVFRAVDPFHKANGHEPRSRSRASTGPGLASASTAGLDPTGLSVSLRV
jgi:hypothetical protein